MGVNDGAVLVSAASVLAVVFVSRLAELRRELANARRRAAYWSGKESYSFNPLTTLRNAELAYEAETETIRHLSNEIARLTGKRPKPVNLGKGNDSNNGEETPLFPG